MTHHPTWSEVRETYLSDPEVAAAAEELHRLLTELPKCVVVNPGHAPAPKAEGGEWEADYFPEECTGRLIPRTTR